MVGPGTGLAPFRSFVLQRHLQAQQQQGATCGQMVLYFGCRRSDQDYLYGKVGQPAGRSCAALLCEGWAMSQGWRGPLLAAARLQHCQSSPGAHTGPHSPTCRRRRCTQDLEEWNAAGTITLHTAFSRMPGQPKVYVQQRLRESADLVWQLLQAGGHFYVSCSVLASCWPAPGWRVCSGRVLARAPRARSRPVLSPSTC
jgi:hypothetical protein